MGSYLAECGFGSKFSSSCVLIVLLQRHDDAFIKFRPELRIIEAESKCIEVAVHATQYSLCVIVRFPLIQALRKSGRNRNRSHAVFFPFITEIIGFFEGEKGSTISKLKEGYAECENCFVLDDAVTLYCRLCCG